MVSWFEEDESCVVCVSKNMLNHPGLRSVDVVGNFVVSGKLEQEVGVAVERGVGVGILDVQEGV